MALQDIDSVNLPGITFDIVPITTMGARTFEGLFTIADIQTRSTVLTSYDVHQRAKLIVYTYIRNGLYNVRVTFLRLFIANYTVISDLKLILYIDGDWYSSINGMQLTGYSSGVETRLMICDSPAVDMSQSIVWTNFFMPDSGSFIPNNNNYIESAIMTTVNGERIITITFNSYGRQAAQGVTAGYIDFCAFIPASLCATIPNTGYCLTSFNSKSIVEVTHS